MVCIRFPDGCEKKNGPGGKPRLIAVRTPFDFILSHDGKAAFIDTKHTTLKNFPYSAIKGHQLRALLELEEQGHPSGYVIFFKEHRRIVFIPASVLGSIKRGESLSYDHGIDLGPDFHFDPRKIFS